jgi:ABC-type glycerol-3-phosphate transport system substrate-binding protein
MSLGREDSGFAFVQGRAGMITSGSWDARSYLKKIEEQPADKRFEVGIFDLPSVAFDDPEFGQYSDGRSSEAGTGTGFAFGITRATRHEDLCVEFLQFCTTPENNTRLNQMAEWIPVIHGAQASPLLEKFKPNYIGYFGRVDFELMAGGKAQLLEGQTYWPLVSGEIDYETYAQRLWKALPPEAATDYKRVYEGNVEALPARQARRSAYLALSVFADPATRVEQETRLLRTWEPLLRNEVSQRRSRRMMEMTLESMTPEQKNNDFNREFRAALDRETSK